MVTVLEGNDRTGGRIHTVSAPGFVHPIELGAEFIHGRMPISFSLLEEAKLMYNKITGSMVRVKNGRWQQQNDFTIDWDLLMKKLHELTEDMTMARFLQTRFAGDEYAVLRDAVQRFAEGFDVADVDKVSALALRKEWSHEEQEQYRVAGGYGLLIQFLENQCIAGGVAIHTGCVVKKISWEPGRVQVASAHRQSFTAHKLVITVPIGVLCADAGQLAAIEFTPVPEAYLQAAANIGYGSVTKLLLQFGTAFWNSYTPNPGFIISEETIGTWWTQGKPGASLLTGWAGGPRAARLEELDEAAIIQAGLQSLAGIFNKTVGELGAELVAARAVSWLREPFSLGAYSYDTIHTAAARQLLRQPLDKTLFFAGEALYEGPSPGTVEAALTSGRDAAARIGEI
jgi:monoamine oxidase